MDWKTKMTSWNLLLQFFIIYGLLTLVLYFSADFAIFPMLKSSYRDSPEIIKLLTGDGKKISSIYFQNPKAKYTILFSHGNFEDIGTLTPFLQEYRDHGFSVFAYDYHGYGTSEGRANEMTSYLDIDAAYQYLTQIRSIPADLIILHGRSVGSGPTVDLATRAPCGGIILESPFLTAFRVITRIPLFPIDKFQNDLKITKVKTPILIIHGKQDEVIPFWHGQELFDKGNSPKTFYAIENAGHNDIVYVAGENYWNAIQKFADDI